MSPEERARLHYLFENLERRTRDLTQEVKDFQAYRETEVRTLKWVMVCVLVVLALQVGVLIGP